MTIFDLLSQSYTNTRLAEDESREAFAADGPEFLAVQLGSLFVSIDRKAGRFAAQRGGHTVRGFADACLTAEELAALCSPRPYHKESNA